MKEPTVAYQKGIADVLLYKLEAVDPYCILAGGAPRDWYFGNTANDFDIYFVSNGATLGAVAKQLDRALESTEALPVKARCGHVSEMYKHMDSLKRIWNTEVLGVPVQLIELNETGDQFRIVDKMDCSICKVWYKNHQLKPTKEFLLGEKLKTMVLNDGYTWSDPHPEKMKRRFGDYALVDKKGFERMMVRDYTKMVLEDKV